MITLKLIHAGKGANYYVQKRRRSNRNPDEYYVGHSSSDGQEVAGYWWGDGLSTLGLKSGQAIHINDPHFKALMNGCHPFSLERLREGRERLYTNPKSGHQKVYRVAAAIDAVTSVPKEVSALWATSSSEHRKRIERAHARATKAALEYVQRYYAQTRTGKGGKKKEKVKLVVAQFEHVTSRNGDAQLHTHNVISAVVLRQDGKWGALDTRNILRYQVPIKLGQYYRDCLRYQLSLEFPDLKLPITEITNGRSFRVVGHGGEEIPQSFIKSLSSRRADIEKAKRSNPDKSMHEIAIETRDRKVENLNKEEFFRRHRFLGKEHGFNGEAFLTRSQEHYTKYTVTMAMLTAMTEEAKRRALGGTPYRREDQDSFAFDGFDWDKPRYSKGNPNSSEVKDQIKKSRKKFQLVYDIDRAFKKAKAASKKKATSWKLRQLLGLSPKPKRQPRTKFGIELKYWAGGLKLSQRLYLRTKYGHGTPKYFIPKSKLAINVAYATKQISRGQQLLLLQKFGHLHERSPEIRSIRINPSQKRK